jgi:hypothetical protein
VRKKDEQRSGARRLVVSNISGGATMNQRGQTSGVPSENETFYSKRLAQKGVRGQTLLHQGTNMATLGGFLPAIVTPLNADKTVDVASLRRLAKHMFESGVDGLYIGGESDPTTHHSVSAHHSCSVFCCPCQWQAGAQPEHCSGTAHAVIERNPLACVFKPT